MLSLITFFDSMSESVFSIVILPHERVVELVVILDMSFVCLGLSKFQ